MLINQISLMPRFIKKLLFLLAAFAFSEAYAQPIVDSLLTFTPVVNMDSVGCQENLDSARISIKEEEIHPLKSKRKPAWLFFAFLVQMGLLAYLKASFPKSIEDMVKGILNINMAQQLYREQELTMPVSAILFSINFVLSGGIFLFLLNHHFGWVDHGSPVVSLLFSLWAVIVIYALKYGAMKLVSWVFPFGSVLDHYNFNFFLVQKIAGMVLFPLNFLIAYAPEFLRTGIAITALVVLCAFVIGKVLKGFVISQNLLRQHVFHFFIYICTLEIAPVCILTKVVVEWVS